MASEVKNKLRDILLWINIGKIANYYFDKKATWLYDKIDGIADGFTQEELSQLKVSLVDLADRIRKCADNL